MQPSTYLNRILIFDCLKAAWGSIIYGQQMCASEMMRYQAKPAMSSILSDLGLEGGFCRMMVAKTRENHFLRPHSADESDLIQNVDIFRPIGF